MARMAAGLMVRPRARAPPAGVVVVVVALLLATSLLVVADASRPLKQLSSSSFSSSEGDGGARGTVESAPVGYIDTVVGGGVDGHHRLMNIDMLGGIKDSGPSPGAGH